MNSEMTVDEIITLLKAGDIAAAEADTLELLKKDPGNLQAKMLYGICCQLLDDEETFKRIHDEIAPVMEDSDCADEHSVSMWRKYHKLWVSLIAGGLVVAGVSGAIYMFGETIRDNYRKMTMAMTRCVYAGPEYFELKKIEGMPDGPEKSARLKNFREQEEQRNRTIANESEN